MIVKKSTLFISAVLITITYFQCGQTLSGVETTNGATVVIQADKVTGTTPPFARVFLYDKSYTPYIDKGLGVATAADRNGNFQFTGVHGDSFTVAVECDYDSQSVVFCAGGNGSDTVRAYLYKPGTLKGSVTSSDSGSILVFLYGTGYYKILKSSGTFIFDALPQGTYQLQAANISKDQFGIHSIQNLSTIQNVNVFSKKVVVAASIVLQKGNTH